MAQIRKSVIAGTWYPGTKEKLNQTLEDFFSNVDLSSIDKKVIGLISPHAGFPFSGQTAAYGYSLIKNNQYDLVVVISPMHRMAFGSYLTTTADYYETPLGEVEVEQNFLKKLSDKIDLKFIADDNEHSLEIQLPFLQYTLKKFKLLPIMISMVDIFNLNEIVNSLYEIIKNKNFLIIASSDFHHISDYQEVKERDKRAVKVLKTFNIKNIKEILSEPETSICGKVPISILLEISKRFDASEIQILHQTNSGDVTGEKIPGQYTVGYVSAAVLK
ncbi:MAG: AmmeMemoRadiSam system protein B [bacterium]